MSPLNSGADHNLPLHNEPHMTLTPHAFSQFAPLPWLLRHPETAGHTHLPSFTKHNYKVLTITVSLLFSHVCELPIVNQDNTKHHTTRQPITTPYCLHRSAEGRQRGSPGGGENNGALVMQSQGQRGRAAHHFSASLFTAAPLRHRPTPQRGAGGRVYGFLPWSRRLLPLEVCVAGSVTPLEGETAWAGGLSLLSDLLERR